MLKLIDFLQSRTEQRVICAILLCDDVLLPIII